MHEETRAAAVTLNRELVALRRTLRAHLGSSHLDYQTLRSSRAATVDEAEGDQEVVSDDSAKGHTASNGSHNGLNGRTSLSTEAAA